MNGSAGGNASRGSRGGFTVMEVTVTSGLMVLLVLLVSSSWSSLGVPTARNAGRAKVAHDAEVLSAFLARDLSGHLTGVVSGEAGSGREVGRLVVNGNELRLCFDGGQNPDGSASWASPDTVIVYTVQGGHLVRWNQNENTTATVIRNIQQFEVTQDGTETVIRAGFRSRDTARSFTLASQLP